MLGHIIQTLGFLLSFCGIPGIASILLLYYLIRGASYEQKKELIDAFGLILNRNNPLLIFVYLIVAFLGLFFIQYSYWRGREKFLKKRIKELERESFKTENFETNEL